MDFIILLCVTGIFLLISFYKSKKKTMKALKMAAKRFSKIAPPILLMVLLVSITFYFFSEEMISKYLGSDNRWAAMLSAGGLGSIFLMPGFIAFPLGGVLKGSGVPMMVIAAFTTTLMMVGLVTIPVEKQYFGTKVAIIRNLIALVIAIIVALTIGLAFGEITL